MRCLQQSRAVSRCLNSGAGLLSSGKCQQRSDSEPGIFKPGSTAQIDPASLGGRTGFRPMSPDRLPIVGAVPVADGSGSPAPANARLATLPRHHGLWCLQGYGARGIVWSALMADLLLSCLEGEPLPLETDLVDALDPGRFLIRPVRRTAGGEG